MNLRGNTWQQAERTINDPANTIANTTGRAVSTGRGTDRTGITDHLTLTFFPPWMALSKHRVNPITMLLRFPQEAQAFPSREMPLTSIVAARSLLRLDPCLYNGPASQRWSGQPLRINPSVRLAATPPARRISIVGQKRASL